MYCVSFTFSARRRIDSPPSSSPTASSSFSPRSRRARRFTVLIVSSISCSLLNADDVIFLLARMRFSDACTSSSKSSSAASELFDMRAPRESYSASSWPLSARAAPRRAVPRSSFSRSSILYLGRDSSDSDGSRLMVRNYWVNKIQNSFTTDLSITHLAGAGLFLRSSSSRADL